MMLQKRSVALGALPLLVSGRHLDPAQGLLTYHLVTPADEVVVKVVILAGGYTSNDISIYSLLLTN